MSEPELNQMLGFMVRSRQRQTWEAGGGVPARCHGALEFGEAALIVHRGGRGAGRVARTTLADLRQH